MTELLYRDDPQLLDFEARVLEVRIRGPRAAVVLDRSAFYPTGGGQPHDVGTLGAHQVVEVLMEGEPPELLHWVEGSGPDTGETVHGCVAAGRRRDHMQQHSGQHILSQAFVEVAGAETTSFHLGAETCTIDLDVSSLDDDVAEAVERRANEIVFENRAVRILEVPAAELHRYPLRRQTYHGDPVRLIEVDGFDLSTCGGTHVASSSEVGVIAVLGLERAKRRCRVEFACGGRALRILREHRRALMATARQLSVGPGDVPAQVARVLDEQKRLFKRSQRWFEQAAAAQVVRWSAEAEAAGAIRIVAQLLTDHSLEEVRLLAQQCGKHGHLLGLLAVEHEGAGRLVFAGGAEVTVSTRDLMQETAAKFRGRGGGSPRHAQGSIADAAELPLALRWAADRAKERLEC